MSTGVLSAVWDGAHFSPGGGIIPAAAESARPCAGWVGGQPPLGGIRRLREVEDAGESAPALAV